MRRGERGQSTVELVGMLPLVAALALGTGQLLAAGVAHELADHAAEAGAVAVLQGGDPEQAARAALPGWSHARVAVTVTGGRVRVRVTPAALVPGGADALASSAEAQAAP